MEKYHKITFRIGCAGGIIKCFVTVKNVVELFKKFMEEINKYVTIVIVYLNIFLNNF